MLHPNPSYQLVEDRDRAPIQHRISNIQYPKNEEEIIIVCTYM
jgi:hypothetical protein